MAQAPSPPRTLETPPAPDRTSLPPAPYRKEGTAPLEFRGPGRDAPEPMVDEVVVGWFGPGDPGHPQFGDLWRGAELGLESANREGGYQGRPFRLVAGWSDSPWSAGVVEVTKMAFRSGAWAVIGGMDGTTTHLAEQVALKVGFSLLTPGSTDGTANLANVPWMLSLLPSDERSSPVLASAVAATTGEEAFGIVAATDHDSHAALVALRRALAERRLTPATLVAFDPRVDEPSRVASRLLEARPRVVVVLAPSVPAGRLVAALRRAGFEGKVLGGATLARRAFVRAAAGAAEGVVVPRLWTESPAWDRFASTYEARWGEPPDDAAGESYDAVRLVAAAVRRAGLNRVRIADALRELAPWPGVAGAVRWDALGRNQREVGLAAWEGGRLRPTDAALTPSSGAQ
jgi:branched-chain amino acid transport system substrate-binding protein